MKLYIEEEKLKRMRIRKINNRMLNFLKVVYENDYMTFVDMILHFGNNCIAYGYLDYARKLNLIEKFETNFKPEIAHCVNENGYKILKTYNLVRHKEMFRPSQYNLYKFHSDEKKRQIGIILLKHPDVLDYMSKKVIKYQKPELTKYQLDGLIITTDNKQIGVRVEIPELKTETYGKKFVEYEKAFEKKQLDKVIWFIYNMELIKGLTKILLSLVMKVNIYKHIFCVRDEFFADWFLAKFYNVDGEINLFTPIEKKEIINISRNKQKSL